MRKKILLITSCLMLFVQTITADILSAKIDKVETVHNIYENGEKGMKICADIRVLGKGNLSMIAYFSDGNGNPLPGSGNYVSGNGKLMTSKRTLCLLEHTDKKVEAFVPYGVFPKTPGTHSIQCQVYLYDNAKKKFLNNNSFKQVSFNFTNPDNMPSANTSKNSVAPKPNRVIYNNPPEISEHYFKTPDGKQVIKLNLSYFKQVEFFNSWTGQFQKGGPSGYSISIEPLGIYTLWADLETYPDYFYFKENINEVRLARDLSWVEVWGERYSQVATISEYNKYRKGLSDLQRALNGGSPYIPNNIPSNGSSNSNNGKTNNTCRICGGSGICKSCSGSGGHFANTGYYTGENIQSWINCGSCGGNKRCFNCFGTGRQ